MTRRSLVLATSFALTLPAPRAALGQPRMRLIGWLGNAPPDSGPEVKKVVDAFVGELERRGWAAGRDYAIEARYAIGDVGRFAALAAELVALEPDLIVAISGNAVAAARRATTKIPIVFVAVPQPVEAGFVASLAHPGGNVTGMTTASGELIGKRLELLKLAFPGRAAIGLLTTPGGAPRDAETVKAAAALGLRLTIAQVADADAIAVAAAARPQPDAWFVQDDTLFAARRRVVVDAFARARRPAVYPQRVFVDVGGEMSYAPSLFDQFVRVAQMVDRVLRGARPAEIPVEQPTRFERVINAGAFRRLGLAVPAELRLRADEVIE